MDNFKETMKVFFKNVKRFFRSKPMRIIGKTLGFILKTILTVFLIGMITACIFGCVLTVYVFNTFSESTTIPDLSRIMDGGTSIIYTQNDNGDWVESQRLEGERSIWKDLPEIPDYMQKAIIAIEDERFYQHEGVDWKRTGAAVINELLGGSAFGGSTITQQLIKVATQDNEVTIERKIREIFTALELERDYYTKDDILESYLNILPLSDNIVGVGAAANYYFGKDISDLSLAECAVIAGITNLPSYYDPYDHPDHAKQRQEVILDKMYELGFITADEYRQAYGEELYYKSSARYVQVQDYYVDLLIEDVIEDLQTTYGYSYAYSENLVFHGGLRIYSYEDAEAQRAVEAIFENDANFPDIAGAEDQPTAAIFIMDYEGRVVATVGDRGEKTGNRVQNIATQSRRQPGSSIKPLGVYAPAMDLDIINYSTLVRDAPIKLADGSLWPHNFGSSVADRGWRTVQYALQQSHNTVPVQILQVMGLDASYSFLTEKLHFTSLEEGDKNYAPLALGGFTYGVTVREMAAGYQIFGNGGHYNSPQTYQRVEVDGGEILLQHVPEMEQAISQETATIMNRLLQKVVTQGTAYAIYDDWVGTQVFAKTGTTDDNKDSYFAGGTPNYVGAVWMGYKDNDQLSEYQRSIAKELWSKSMLALHNLLDSSEKKTEFDLGGDVQGHYYDSSTGIVSSYGSTYGYYKSSNVPYSSNTLGGINYTPAPAPQTTTTPAPETTTAPSEITDPSGEVTDPSGEVTDPSGGEVTDPSGGEGDVTDPPSDTSQTLPPPDTQPTAPPEAPVEVVSDPEEATNPATP